MRKVTRAALVMTGAYASSSPTPDGTPSPTAAPTPNLTLGPTGFVAQVPALPARQAGICIHTSEGPQCGSHVLVERPAGTACESADPNTWFVDSLVPNEENVVDCATPPLTKLSWPGGPTLLDQPPATCVTPGYDGWLETPLQDAMANVTCTTIPPQPPKPALSAQVCRDSATGPECTTRRLVVQPNGTTCEGPDDVWYVDSLASTKANAAECITPPVKTLTWPKAGGGSFVVLDRSPEDCDPTLQNEGWLNGTLQETTANVSCSPVLAPTPVNTPKIWVKGKERDILIGDASLRVRFLEEPDGWTCAKPDSRTLLVRSTAPYDQQTHSVEYTRSDGSDVIADHETRTTARFQGWGFPMVTSPLGDRYFTGDDPVYFGEIARERDVNQALVCTKGEAPTVSVGCGVGPGEALAATAALVLHAAKLV